MSAVTRITPRPRVEYKAWASSGECAVWPIDLRGAVLADIEREIAHSASQGETVFILETDHLEPSQTVHAYRIRQGKWNFQRNPHTLAKVYPHYADKLFTLPVNAFDPVGRFRCTPGSDALGIGLLVIEAA